MPQKLAILLDSNAGAPLHPFVKKALFAFLNADESIANPASVHSLGRSAADYIAETEKGILKTFNASPSEWSVVFTSGGTESNQLAIRSAFDSLSSTGARAWAFSEIEHSCVLNMQEEMSKRGARYLKVRPSSFGEIPADAQEWKEASLISVIGVGNETGIQQPSITSHIQSAHSFIKKPIFHMDFVAGWGKAVLDLSQPDSPDFVAIAGHKLGGLPGSGAILHRKRIRVIREGTPNFIGIVGLRALTENWTAITEEYLNLKILRDRFEFELMHRFPKVIITGQNRERVLNVSHFYFPNLNRNLSLVTGLDIRGFAVSSGSACASQVPAPSHVLLAMGLDPIDARNALRVSLHPGNTWSDLEGLLNALSEIFRRYEER